MTRVFAYSVHDGDEGLEIVYAARAASARLRGANALDTDPDCVEVSRIRWADEFYGKPIPPLVKIAHGWWYECAGCDCRIDDEMEDNRGDEPRALKPVERGQLLFCAAECRDAHDEQRRRRKLAEAALIDGLSARLLQQVPEAEITGTHAYVQSRGDMWEASQGIVYFRFPGCGIGDASFRFDKPGEEPRIWVCGGDLPAWDAFRNTSTGSPDGR